MTEQRTPDTLPAPNEGAVASLRVGNRLAMQAGISKTGLLGVAAIVSAALLGSAAIVLAARPSGTAAQPDRS